MTFNIDRSRITRTSPTLTASVRNGQVVIRRSKKEGDRWIDDSLVVSEPFAVDIWQMCHGYEVWAEKDGKKSREFCVVPLDQPAPETPIDGQPIYLLPIYHRSWGGRADLVISDKVASDALDALCTEIQTWDEVHSLDPVLVPIIEVVGTQDSLFGSSAVFAVSEWCARPERWGRVLIQPKPAERAVDPMDSDQDIMAVLRAKNQRAAAGVSS